LSRDRRRTQLRQIIKDCGDIILRKQCACEEKCGDKDQCVTLHNQPSVLIHPYADHFSLCPEHNRREQGHQCFIGHELKINGLLPVDF
jgi:hypothetical protein